MNSPYIQNLEKLCNTDPIMIDSVGAIASGKSFFLSHLHNQLGYPTKGIRINKFKMKKFYKEFKEKMTRIDVDEIVSEEKNILTERNYSVEEDRYSKGIRRTSATNQPDHIKLFLTVDDKIIPVDLFASGGHANVEKKENPDGVIYFADLDFSHFVSNLRPTILFSFSRGHEFEANDRYILNNILNSYSSSEYYSLLSKMDNRKPETVKAVSKFINYYSYKFKKENLAFCMYPFGLPIPRQNKGSYIEFDELIEYHHEFLGNIMDSIYRSFLRLDSLKDVPASLVLKHSGTISSSYYLKDGHHNNLSYENQFIKNNDIQELVRDMNDKILKAMDDYVSYLYLHSDELLSKHNIVVPPYNFTLLDNLDNFVHTQVIDSYSRSTAKKKKNVHIIHTLLSEILKQKGIEYKEMRIVNFTPSSNPLLINYEEVMERYK